MKLTKVIHACCGNEAKVGDWPMCDGDGDHTPSKVKTTWEAYEEIHAHTEPFWCDSYGTLKKKMKENSSDFLGRKPGMPGQEI